MPSISPVPSSTVNGTTRSAQVTVQIERLIPDGPLDVYKGGRSHGAAERGCSSGQSLAG